MKFEEADILCDLIVAFMVDAGGPYSNHENCRGWLECEVITALAQGRYILRIDGAEVKYFASFWLVDSSEIDDVVNHKVKPSDPTVGDTLYVAEAAIASGYMAEVVRESRRFARKHGTTGCHWHNTGRSRGYSSQRQK